MLLYIIITTSYGDVMLSSSFYRLENWVRDSFSNFSKVIPLGSSWAGALPSISFPLSIHALKNIMRQSREKPFWNPNVIRILEPKSESLWVSLFSLLIIVIHDCKEMSMNRDVEINYVLLQYWRKAEDILILEHHLTFNCIIECKNAFILLRVR